MAEQVYQGSAASPGLAIGPLVRPASPGIVAQSGAGPEEETRRLGAALSRAAGELAQLALADAGMGAEILEFQLALLDDPALADPAYAAITTGESAAMAWRHCLDGQIAEYETAEDDYFRARASDLRDLQERVLAALGAGSVALDLPAGAILLDRDLTPSRFLALEWSRLGGAALEAGSPSSHVAMLARARGVPLVTGLGDSVASSTDAVLDAEAGLLVIAPAMATRARYAARLAERATEASVADRALAEPAVTAAGERVEVMLNVDDPAAVSDDLLEAADGVGLLRTEFLFIGRDRLPDEIDQFEVYVALLHRLRSRPCIVRTLDVGGDKALPGVSLPEETNPFLGLRGLRLCLDRPELFRPQVRALLRAAVGRTTQGHAAHGGDGRRARGGPQLVRGLPLRAQRRAGGGRDAAARHHGRDPGRRGRRSI